MNDRLTTTSLLDIDTREVWSSESGGTTQERARVTFEVFGEYPTKQEFRRMTEDALMDSNGYVGVIENLSVGEPEDYGYGSQTVDVFATITKEW